MLPHSTGCNLAKPTLLSKMQNLSLKEAPSGFQNICLDTNQVLKDCRKFFFSQADSNWPGAQRQQRAGALPSLSAGPRAEGAAGSIFNVPADVLCFTPVLPDEGIQSLSWFLQIWVGCSALTPSYSSHDRATSPPHLHPERPEVCQAHPCSSAVLPYLPEPPHTTVRGTHSHPEEFRGKSNTAILRWYKAPRLREAVAGGIHSQSLEYLSVIYF